MRPAAARGGTVLRARRGEGGGGWGGWSPTSAAGSAGGATGFDSFGGRRPMSSSSSLRKFEEPGTGRLGADGGEWLDGRAVRGRRA